MAQQSSSRPAVHAGARAGAHGHAGETGEHEESHGHSLAAWTLVAGVLIGTFVVCLAMVIQVLWLAIVGGVILVGGLVAGACSRWPASGSTRRPAPTGRVALQPSPVVTDASTALPAAVHLRAPARRRLRGPAVALAGAAAAAALLVLRDRIGPAATGSAPSGRSPDCPARSAAACSPLPVAWFSYIYWSYPRARGRLPTCYSPVRH